MNTKPRLDLLALLAVIPAVIQKRLKQPFWNSSPLLFSLFKTHQADFLLKRLEQHVNSKHCILFRPDLAQNLGGGCSQYSMRPLICRLFGFAGSHDKNGRIRLSQCRHITRIQAKGEERLTSEKLPIFQEYGLSISTLHPTLGLRRMSMNSALYQALLKVGLFLDLTTPPSNNPLSPKPQSTPSGHCGHLTSRAA